MSIQKHIILLASVLFVSAGVALGQSTLVTIDNNRNDKKGNNNREESTGSNRYTDGITASNVKHSVKEGKMSLEMTLDIKEGVLKTVQGVAIVPVVTNDADKRRVSFPYVLVNGVNQNKMYKRRLKYKNTELLNNMPQAAMMVDNRHRGATIQYKGEIDNDSWMTNAALGVRLVVVAPADKREYYYFPLVEALPAPTVAVAPPPQPPVVVVEQPKPEPQIIYIERPAPKPEPEPVAMAYTPEPDIVLPQTVEVPKAVMIASAADHSSSTYQVSGAAFLDFELGSSRLRTDYKNNAREIGIIQRVMSDVARNSQARITVLEIVGYASPESRYDINASLARERANALADYIQNRYGISSSRSTVRSVAEDWRKLRQLVMNSNLPYKSEVIKIIDDSSLAPDAKESKIRRMMGGAIWNNMENSMFPQLRRVEYRIEYTVPH